MKQHKWHTTLTFGDDAAELVANKLRAQGKMVVDMTKLPDAQRRGVDYLVDDEYIDIKADTHSPVNFFLEVECDGKPGCFFKSRADAWLYYFPADQKLYRLDLPHLQLHLARHLATYQQRKVTSVKGSAHWVALGALVPIEELLTLGIAQDISRVLTASNTTEYDEQIEVLA